MTTIVRTFPPELEDALYSLVIAAKVPDAAALAERVQAPMP